MMRLTKRVFSAFLAFVMVFTMLPLDAWAADGTSDNSLVAPMNVVEPDEKNKVDTYEFYKDGTLVDTQYVMSGDTVFAPKSPEKEGYKFTGWNTNEDGTGDAFTPGQKDDVTGVTYTYHAVFQQVYYVFFLNQDGVVCTTKEGVSGASISTADVTFPMGTDEGIEGWYYDENCTQPAGDPIYIGSENITLYPKVETGNWITFESDGGSYIAPVFVAPNAVTAEPTAPTRPGYTFLGWYNGDQKFTFGQLLTESVTLTARWQGQPVKYKVFYWKENANNDEYSLAKSDEMSGIAGEQTRAGTDYNAGKGFHLSEKEDKKLEQKIIEGDGSTIVNVYYDREEYTIEFYRFTCKSTSWVHSHQDSCWKIDNEITIKAKYGADISLQWPSNDNYGSAWSVSQGATRMQVHMETMPNENRSFYEPTSEGNKTLTASYYVESLDGQRGEEQKGGVWYDLHHKDVSKGSDGTSITDDDKYAIEGFTFKEYTYTHTIGWYGDPAYDGAKFYYTRDDYTLTFVNGSDKTTKTVQYEADISQYGSVPATRPAGVGENYTFQGWYLDEALQTEYDFTGKTMPAYNVTVYAKWAAPEVKVTVYVTIDGTGEPTVLDIPLGSVIDQSELPEVDNREGYTLHGWATKNADGTFVPFNMDQEIHVNTTIYPYFISNEVFSVKYDLNDVDGTAPTDNKSYKEDSYADIQYSGNIEDAIFLYWNTEPNGSGDTYYPGDKMQIKAADAVNNVITLYAIWGDKAPTATLVYAANNGTGKTTTEYVANNETVQLKTAEKLGFTWDGYEFLGWSKNSAATEAEFAAEGDYIVNNKDGVNTLYAVWERSVFPGTPITVEVIKDGEPVTASGYVDVSEYKDGGGTAAFNATPDGNVIKVTYEYDNLNCADITLSIKSGVDITGYDVSVTSNSNLQTVGEVDSSKTATYELTQNGNSWNLNNVSGGATVTVTLKKLEYTVTYKPGDHGTLVEANADGNVVYNNVAYGSVTPAEPAVTPEEGYYFAGWAPAVEETVTKDATYVAQYKEKYEITVEAKSDTAKYDGTEKTVSGLVTDTFTVNGQTYTVEGLSAGANGTDAGTYTSEVTGTAVVKDANKNDVTSQFTVKTQAGTLTIEKRNVTLTSATDSKEYDGTPLTNDEVTVGGDGFADGEGATYTVTGSQTLVGESANMFTYQLNEGTKAGNYIVTPEYGKLTVTDRESKYEITVEAKSDTAKYDGTEKTVSGLVTDTFTVNGQTYTVEGLSAGANGTDAGTYTSEVTGTAIVKDAADNDVTDQFVVSTTNGTLEIQKRNVTLTSATGSKEYDGKPLTRPDVAVGGDGFVEGEVTDVKATGSQLYVGESVNTIEYTAGEKFKESNYNITKTEGTLTVTAPDPTEFPYITKSHDETKAYYPGDTVTYTITVKNIFSVDAVVTVTEQSGVTLVGADDGAITQILKPGTEGVYTATYTVDENDLVDNAFHNTVSVTIVPMDDDMEPIEDTATDTVPVNVPELSVEKQITSDPANGEYYVLKEEIAYKITVKNTGNVTVSNITVEDKLAEEVWTIESLNPGESKEFETSHQVAEADLGSPYVNVATAEGEAPNGSEVKAEDSATATTDSRTPKLDVTKTATKPANGTEYALDETITYTITVKNTGNVTLEDIFVSDEFSRDDGATWDVQKDKLTPSASTPITLEPGEQKIYTYQYTVVEEDLGKTLKNTATATAPNPDDPSQSVTDGATTPGEKVENPDPKLEVVKTVLNEDEEPFDLGEVIHYQITVSNTGNVTLTGVNVVDELLADGVKIHDLDVKGGDNITLAPKGHEGDSVTLYVDYTVKEEDLGKTLVNTVTVESDQTKPDPEDPNNDDHDETDGEETADPTPDLDVTKEVVNKQESYQVGDVITYQITVKNTGNTTIHNVELMDHMNAHGKVTFKNLGGGQMVGGSPVLAALAPKTAWVVTCQYTVQLADADSDGTTISNKVTVNAEDGPDGKDPEDQTPGEDIDPIYTLTIKYQNGARVDLRNPDTVKLHAGDVYTVVAPGINGYHLSDKAYAEFDFTMRDRDTTIVIIYAANPVEDDDDDPVVNPDNDPDETTEETTEETEDEVDPGVYIEDPDDYTLTPITEEEPPLADLDVGDHTCCIMHFLLMLAAMVVLGFYTDSKKKHQARIFELKRTLAMEKGKNPDGDNSQQS